MPKLRPLSEIIAHLRTVIANPQIDTTLIQTQDLALLCDTLDRLRARNAELEAALEDAIDTLEAMNFHDSPLYNRLRTALAREGKE